MAEKKGEYAFNPSSIFKNTLCEDDALPFLDHSRSNNIGSESNVINYFDQSVALGNNSFDDDDSVDVCDHKSPGVSSNLLVSHEYFNLDPESNSIKEDVLIETSSSSHYPLCSIIYDASTCDQDTPCSLISSSIELSS